MTPRARLLAFGSAVALTVVGALCLALVEGIVGQVLAIAGITFGLGAVVLLLFFEVGLSEDQARAHEGARRRPRPDAEGHVQASRPSRLARRPRRRG